jgi:hypothetical protein
MNRPSLIVTRGVLGHRGARLAWYGGAQRTLRCGQESSTPGASTFAATLMVNSSRPGK